MDAFVAGGCSYNAMVYLDEFPRETETHRARDFRETVGSTGAGKTMNLGRLGLDVTFHAMLGDDRYGRIVRETFADEPATFLHDVDPNGTERHVNLMNAEGERISIFVVESTPAPDIDYERLERLVKTCDAFVVNPVDYTRPLLAAAERHDTPVWCDVHAYDGVDPHHDAFVDAADYLFLSEEGMDDPTEFMRERVDAGTELVVCTRGADGSTALTADGERIEVPAESFEMVDTNGAGDAYVSGFLYGHAQGEDTETCMRLGTLAGGLAVESPELAHAGLSAERLALEYEDRYGSYP
ncbi:carbohydrate kinase family protein [Halobium salinum]|uniref:Carbohydrate kinase family protein n=1 Tax=Halobium salinum TaxID=1364940 RepID=A0ABD5PE29_9EURY|nr:carbohydrate kinase family protein [Halobium salinum]